MARRTNDCRVVLFGDVTMDPVPTIRQLAQDAKHFTAVNAYLRLCNSALQSELSRSTLPSKRHYPRFGSIIELAEWLSQLSEPQISISAVLLCVAQVGILIRDCELDPSILIPSETRPIYAVGLCNGMIGAAALATCRSTTDLLESGPRLVCLNLRLFLVLLDRSGTIEEAGGTWTVITPHLSAADHEPLISSFITAENSLPTSHIPYVSAEADGTSTISGPPSTLAKYFSSCKKLEQAKKLQVPINTACHAPHLRFDDLNLILGEFSQWRSSPFDRHVHFVSTHTGKLIEAEDLATLLLQIVDEILNRTFRWGTVLQELCDSLKSITDRVTIHKVGPDRVSTAIKDRLKGMGLEATIAVELSASSIASKMPNWDDIAIVGMSSRLPGGGDDLNQIWQLLEKGRDTHSKVPIDRFDLGDHYDPTAQQSNTTTVQFGCFLENPGLFDASLFNMSPREAKQTDPMQRLALLTTYEALEMAGYSPNALPSFYAERVGTFFGQTLDDYRETNMCQDVDIYYVSGGIRAFGPGRINYHFKWEGPSMSVDTACSSSALAIQLAFQALRNGECDLAVAGGMNIMTSSDMYAGLARGGFLSPTGQCKTFSDAADGYCRGEGVGTVVLKRLQDAITDHDNILAVIKSVSTNHSAFAKSITHPHKGAQVKVMRQILRDAGVEPKKVDYVEMHGTGTPAGDPVELASVAEVFGHGRDEQHPVHVGSIKANFGHGEAVAGVNSLIKSILILRNNAIPPNIGVGNQISTRFADVDLSAISIPRKSQPLPRRETQPRTIVINSFNAAGGNTAMVIEDGPKISRNSQDPRSHHVIAITAHSRKAFVQNQRRLLDFLNGNAQTKVADLAYTTTARRVAHPIRSSIVASDISQVIQSLSRSIAAGEIPSRIPKGRKIIFTFTGQGSHDLDMARALLSTSPTFRNRITMYDSLCSCHGLPSLLRLFQEQSIVPRSQAEEHLSIFAIQMALVTTLEDWGVKPDIVIGHSIGEYAALATAGVLSVSDALYLVGHRGQLVDGLCKHGDCSMLAVSIERAELDKLISTLEVEGCAIACHNGPSSFAISGPRQALSQLADKLTTMNIISTFVGVEYGYHSPQMAAVGKGLGKLCVGLSFQKPQIPVASTLLGKVVHTTGVFNAEYLVRQTLNSVLFQEALRDISMLPTFQNGTVWLEIGTQPICGQMITNSLEGSTHRTLYTLRRREQPWLSISKAVAGTFDAGLNVNWSRFHEDHHHALSVIDLPTYSFDLQNYWIPYRNSWKLKKGKNQRPDSVLETPKIDSRLSPFHYLKSEEIDEGKARVHFVCDLKQDKLLSMIQGHLVNGVGLCPSSVYAHLAYNAATYVFRKVADPNFTAPGIDLREMNIISPLVVSKDCKTALLSITAEWKSVNPHVVEISFATSSDVEYSTHCRCTLITGDVTHWQNEWQEHEYLILERTRHLKIANQDRVQSILQDMLYYFFSSVIVKYSTEYQICHRININYDQNECSAELQIPDGTVNKNGSPGPFCLDALMHTPGFVLNSNPRESHDTVFIASGWASLRLAEPLRAGETYFCHARMAEADTTGLFTGNVSIFSGDRIIGSCRGLRFHRLKRNSLNKLLGINSRSASPAKQPIPSRSKVPPPRAQSGSRARSSSAHNEYSGALEDIATETGIAVSDLYDDMQLSTLGLDSIMSVALLKRFEKRTRSTLSPNIFEMYPSVGELRKFLASKFSPRKSTSQELEDFDTTTRRPPPSATTFGSSPAYSGSLDRRKSEMLCEVIASEVGIQPEEVRNVDQFSELGIDSLLMIAIINQYKKLTGGHDIGVRFFNDNPSLREAFQTLDTNQATPPTHHITLADPNLLSEQETLTGSNSSESESVASSIELTAPADLSVISMLLQGDANDSAPALFLLPDGSGSLFSYIHLPNLKEGLPVYAFDSPFHRNPQDFNVSFETVAAAYVQEMHRIQPQGPYIVAGWSLGGVHAYEVARQLLEAGEEVQQLIMLDSPCPGTLPPLPHASLDLLEKAGIFESLSKSRSNVADHTREHFVQITSAFNQWRYRPLTRAERTHLGQVSIIWARHGVLEDDDEARNAWVPGLDKLDADMLKAKEWLTGKRTDFTDGGWQRLVGKDIKIQTVSGDHFSMMFPPMVTETGELLRKVL